MSESFNMFDEFRFTGYWRRPENPANRWAGTITYKPNANVELELAAVGGGLFIEPDPKLFPLRTNRILGELPVFPYKITLIDNLRTGDSSSTYTRLSKYRYWAEYLLMGHWFPTNEDVLFNSILVRYSSLRGWMWLESPFWGERDGNKTTLTFGGEGLLHRFRICSIDSTIGLHQHIGSTTDEISHRLEADNYFRIVSDSPTSLTCFRKRIDNIRDLLTFLTGFPVETKGITGNLSGADQFSEKAGVFHGVRYPEADKTYFSEIMFPLRLLKNVCHEVFNAWFERSEELQIPYTRCLDVIRSDRQHALFDFLLPRT